MRWRAVSAPLALALAAACARASAGDDGGVSAQGDGPEARDPVDAPQGGRADALAALDASPGTPDAAPPPPDAPPPPPLPDARPTGAPDAPPCMPTWVALLANPTFDSGPGGMWTEMSSGDFPIVTNDFSPNAITAHSPSYAAWLAGFDLAHDQLWQQVAVPAGTTMLRLSGQRLIGTADSTTVAFDFLYVRLRNSSGVITETLATFSNVDAVPTWTPFTATAPSPHAGETVQLYLEATTDFWPGTHTNFFVDSLVLEAFTCASPG